MYKVKKIIRESTKIIKNIFNYLSFKYIRISLYLVIIILILLLICIYIDGNEQFKLLTSILSNISAGLFTGIVLLLIPNIKKVNKLKIKKTNEFYKDTINRIEVFEKTFKKINWIDMDEKNYDTLYDSISYANNINVYIQQDQFINKMNISTINNFKQKFKYDESIESKKCEDIRELIMEMGFSDFDFKKLRNELKNNKIKLELINKSII